MNLASTNSRLAFGLLAGASAVPAASGSIVVFDTNDLSVSGWTIVDKINRADGTFSTGANLGNFVPPTIVFGVSLYYNFLTIQANPIRTLSSNPAGTVLALLDLGDSISGEAPGFGGNVSATLSSIGTGTHYVGLRWSDNSQDYYGWLQFTLSSYSDIKINQFAFNDVAGQSILAGQTTAVPEASTLGFAGGLFGLVALAHARRRQQKQPAASEKFLSLAAGEKLN